MRNFIRLCHPDDFLPDVQAFAWDLLARAGDLRGDLWAFWAGRGMPNMSQQARWYVLVGRGVRRAKLYPEPLGATVVEALRISWISHEGWRA